MLNNQTLLELIEKYKGERTFFDGELVGAFFTVGHLEKLVEEVVKKYLITEQEPAQEPVATVRSYNGLVGFYANQKQINILKDKHEHPLYLHPHQWQGLTAEEIASIPLNEHTVQTVEKILKRKNT